MSLLPFVVLYLDTDFAAPEASLFQADDMEHADEQMRLESPTVKVLWVSQTTSAELAFKDYHQNAVSVYF
jgi:hypothetical protein